MSEKIFLGIDTDNEKIFLSKHEWACKWYWSFGWLGNRNLHFHMDAYLDGKHFAIEKVFLSTKITSKEWWIILDLFKQAYSLKDTAAVYQYGGHLTSAPGLTDLIRNKEKADELNKDLKFLLDTTWNYILSLNLSERK